MTTLRNLSVTQALQIDNDIRHLESHGVWSEGRIPAWAKTLGERFGAAPANHVVIDAARTQVIATLRASIETDPLRNGSRVAVPRDLLEEADPDAMAHDELLGWVKDILDSKEGQA